MHFVRVFVWLCLAFSSHALSYWIDSSCTGKLDNAVLDEVKLMGSEGSTRLGDPGDNVMADAFLQIFKVDKTNVNAVGKATTAFDVIRLLQETSDIKSSNIRIYCDNDARWQLVPDIPSAGRRSKNSRKPPDLQQWWDPVNFIYRSFTTRGCLDEGTLGERYHLKDKEADDLGVKGGHTYNRESITICDKGLATGKVPFLSSIPITKDLTTARSADKIDSFQDMISMTLFHELCHLASVIGIPGNGGGEAIGWKNIVDLTAAELQVEADPFAFLGLVAILNSRNFRLAADSVKRTAGELEFVATPVPPAQRRAMLFIT